MDWVIWVLLSVMLVCIARWAATGAVALLFGAVLDTLVMLYVVMFTDL